MNIMSEFFDIAFAFKLQVTPLNLFGLIILGLMVAVIWRWFKVRIK